MNTDYFLHFRTMGDLKNKANIPYKDPYNITNSKTSLEQALVNNPFYENENEVVQALSIVNNEIVGNIFYFPSKIKVNNNEYKACSASSLFVSPSFRKYATMGFELLENGYNQNSSFFVIGGVTKDAVQMNAFYGAKEFTMPRYLLLKRSKTILKAKLKLEGALLNSVCNIVDQILSFQSFVLRMFIKIRLSNFTVEEVSDIPIDISDLQSNNSYKFQEFHDRRWFEWALNNKFYDEDGFKKHFFVVKNKSNSMIAFFMINERNHEKISIYENVYVGSVIEWETKDEKILSEKMLSLLALMSFGKHIDVVEFATTNQSSINLFKRIGMRQIGRRNMMVKIMNKKVSELFKGYDKIENWRLRPAIGDTMMY